MLMREFLCQHLVSHTISRDGVTKAVAEDEDLLFNWDLSGLLSMLHMQQIHSQNGLLSKLHMRLIHGQSGLLSMLHMQLIHSQSGMLQKHCMWLIHSQTEG